MASISPAVARRWPCGSRTSVLDQHDRDGVRRGVREGEIHAARSHELPRGSVELDGRAGPLPPDHLDLAPDGDLPDLERLGERLLGGEPDREGFRRAVLLAAVGDLGGGEDLLEEAGAPALDGPRDAAHFHDVHTDRDHDGGAPGLAGALRAERRGRVQLVDDLDQLVDVVQVVVGPRVLRAEGVAVARERGPDAQLGRPHHVALRPIPDHDRLGWRDIQELERALERLRAGLALPRVLERDHRAEEMLELELRQAHPGLEPGRVRDDGELQAPFQDLHEREVHVRVENEVGVPGAAIGHDAAGQELVIDRAEVLFQEDVEDLLVLDPLAVVDAVDPLRGLLARELEARVDHAVHGRVDRGALHLHEVREGVVQVEDDGSDQGWLAPENDRRREGGQGITCRRRAPEIGRYPSRMERDYFWDWPTILPRLISPLSMRTLNPQVGFVQTQALKVIGAPSRP